MTSSLDHFPRFEPGSPSAQYSQISNYSVNYLEGLLVNLMHMELPSEGLDKPTDTYQSLQNKLLNRERTVRHAFQFQIEKLFSEFKTIRRSRLNANRASDWTSLGLAGQNSSRVLSRIESIGDKYQKRFDSRINNQLRRLKLLVHRSDEVKDENPLSPENLCHAFLACVEALNLTSIKICELFELFDFVLDEQLNNFYIQIDIGMYYLDILPELTDPELFSSLVPDDEDEAETQAAAELEQESESITEIDDFEQILLINRQLKKRRKRSDKESSNKVNSLNTVDQHLLVFRKLTAEGFSEHAEVFHALQQDIYPFIDEQQRKDIAKFSHYYSNLLNNPLLSPPLTEQLSRLSGPFIELVLTEGAFFCIDSHPVHDFLQSIIDFEIRCKHQDVNLDQLTGLIDTLVKLFNPVSNDFTPVIQSYDAFKKKELKALRKQKKAYEATETNIKQYVLDLVNEITQNLVVEQETLGFFYDDWQLLLLQIARKLGQDSNEFQQGVKIARILSWALDEDREPNHPEYSNHSFRAMLKAIDKGLESLNFSSEHRHRVRKQLLREFREVNTRTHISVVPSTPLRPSEEIELFSSIIGERSSKLTELNTRITVHTKQQPQTIPASDLHLGCWVEIKMARKNVFKRAKLKWISRRADQFVFVDQRGHKIRQASENELERELATGEIKLLNNPALSHRSATVGSGYRLFTGD